MTLAWIHPLHSFVILVPNLQFLFAQISFWLHLEFFFQPLDCVHELATLSAIVDFGFSLWVKLATLALTLNLVEIALQDGWCIYWSLYLVIQQLFLMVSPVWSLAVRISWSRLWHRTAEDISLLPWAKAWLSADLFENVLLITSIWSGGALRIFDYLNIPRISNDDVRKLTVIRILHDVDKRPRIRRLVVSFIAHLFIMRSAQILLAGIRCWYKRICSFDLPLAVSNPFQNRLVAQRNSLRFLLWNLIQL